ncbi:MAG: hypothetical protein WAU75_21500 [Solirubrobacteraceae bacterium]
MTIGGLPLPGSAPPLEEAEPELLLEVAPAPPLDDEDDADDDDDDDELPQAAKATTAIRTAPLKSARLRTDCIYSPSEVANCNPSVVKRMRLPK